MAVWSVKPDWKKSIIERQTWTKKGVAGYISHEIGWRWGEFTVVTDDDTPPELEEGVDIYSCGYDAEMIELNDGCWEETEFDLADEDLIPEIETFLEENSILDLEELGWELEDTEMIINCEMTIELIEKTDGTKAEEDSSVEEDKKWPFA
jgi:hypothetical protein